MVEQNGSAILVPAHPGWRGKKAVKGSSTVVKCKLCYDCKWRHKFTAFSSKQHKQL